MMTDDIVEAAQNFKEVWGDTMLADSIADSLTCKELEALTRLLRAVCDEDSARTWTECHTKGDEPGDLHFQRNGPLLGEQRSMDS